LPFTGASEAKLVVLFCEDLEGKGGYRTQSGLLKNPVSEIAPRFSYALRKIFIAAGDR
jgi:hypothetical protein